MVPADQTSHPGPVEDFDVPFPVDDEAAVQYAPERDGERGGPTMTEAQRQNLESKLMGIDGVKGVGIGRSATGDDTVVVYVRDASVIARVQSEIEGTPVEFEVTGEIDTLPAR